MSGICGLFNLDDEPVAEAELRAMTAMLERRGPERTGRWRDGPAGLGHTLLATTPELLYEQQPFMHRETGCVVTADVRLDNRDELLESLGMAARGEMTGDAELILCAYLAWGERCLDRLLGDFAFALWDPRERRLFCARDHFGMRPFYYHYVAGHRFVFASDARAILVLPQVPYQISEGRIADFLVPQLEWIDYTSTFFEGVYRLPPGHKATIKRGEIEVAEYWTPEPGPEPGQMSDQDYRDGFLEVFTKAVDSRLRAPAGTVGSMLSGGMDSGSVVAVAKAILETRSDQPLPTFSAVRREDKTCAESRAIAAAVTMPSISPTLVYLEDLKERFEVLISSNEEPFDGEFTILKAIYQAARSRGQHVVFDGAGGDVVLSEGTYIARLLRRGELRLAITEIAGDNRFWGGRMLGPDIFRHLLSAVTPNTIKTSLRAVRHRLHIEGYLKSSLISREFAVSVDIKERFDRMQQTFQGGRRDDYAVERCKVIRPNVTAGRERYARLAGVFAIEPRDPFLDRRVVDYCTRLPGRFRLKDGWPKIILRDLMDGRLPDEVRWARGKPHLGGLFNASVTREAVDRGALDIVSLRDDLHGFVESAALVRAWEAFRRDGNSASIHSAFMLSMWLRENAQRPLAPD